MLKSPALSALLAMVAGASCLGDDLDVQVTDLKSSGGTARICLWKVADGFPADEPKAHAVKVVAIRGKSASVTFEGLDPGTYTISTMHDENGNGRMDTNLVGVPKEGYAVSNGVPHRMSAPKFKEATFRISAPRQKVAVKMLY